MFPFQGQLDHGTSQSTFNPSLNINNVNPSSLDLSHFNNSHVQPRPPHLIDGNIQSHSPNLQQGPFQVPSVVPAKRARPGAEQLNASPPPSQGSHSHSRSQTPHQQPQPPPGSQPGVQPFPPPNPLQHFNSGTPSHATPSPTAHHQPFRNGHPQTPSSHPFSPTQVNGPVNPFGGQPQHLQHNPNPMSTPQNAVHPQFMRGMPHGGQGPGQDGMLGGGSMGGRNIAGFPGPQGPMMPPQVNPQVAQDPQRTYQMHLQRTQQQLAGSADNMQNRGMPNPMEPAQANLAASMNGQPRGPMVPPFSQPTRPRMLENHDPRAQNFMARFRQFMASTNRQLNLDPRVCGRPIHWFQLFQLVYKLHPGQSNERWLQIARQYNFPETQLPQAVHELRALYDHNLADFMVKYSQMLQEKRVQGIQQGHPGQMMGSQVSPTQPRHPMDKQQQGPGPSPFPFGQPSSISSLQSPIMQTSSSITDPGGLRTPSRQSSVAAGESHPKTSSATPQLPSPQQLADLPPLPSHSDSPREKGFSGSPRSQANNAKRLPDQVKDLDPNYIPRSDIPFTHGGYPVARRIDEPGEDLTLTPAKLAELGGEVGRMKSSYPMYEDLGLVDIHALTMALQSGFHSEVTRALDEIVALSSKPLLLPECRDLVEVLVECAEEQLDSLVDHAGPVSETITILPYEQYVMLGREELRALRYPPTFGDLEHELEHAVDRLGAITAILRHMSFPDPSIGGRQFQANQRLLASPFVVSFLAELIRKLGTRDNLLRSPGKTTDILKDIITFLSNVADNIELASEDDALALLHLLLAFAPCLLEDSDATSTIRFLAYEPNKHQYLPCAIDSLAKILARDDPNRTYYKSIFQSDNNIASPRTGRATHQNNCSKPLLTRTFALCLAPLPTQVFTPKSVHVSQLRQPFLSQAMLAADILSSLAPTTPALARAWLDSPDDWAPRLLRLTLDMAMTDANMPPERDARTNQIILPETSMRGFQLITYRALAMLRRLVEKAEGEGGGSGGGGGGGGSSSIRGGAAEAIDGANGDAVGAVGGVGAGASAGTGWESADGFRERLARMLPSEKVVFAAVVNGGIDAEVVRHILALARMRE